MLKLKSLSFAAALVLAGCASPSAPPAAKPAGSLFVQAFQARGIVKELQPDGKTVVISHEEIPGYMPAMVMPFTAGDTNELRGLAAGDLVSFQLVTSADTSWIEQVKKLDAPRAPTAPPALPPTLRVVREVEPLKEGDLLPDYTFTNQLGQPVRLADFRGQALAI
ncbi:MAG: copper-binding protein, partial [Verrucomicrobia bacterium]|nr:copper-binding protein [Verrucomicrobiota bacterium]